MIHTHTYMYAYSHSAYVRNRLFAQNVDIINLNFKFDFSEIETHEMKIEMTSYILQT